MCAKYYHNNSDPKLKDLIITFRIGVFFNGIFVLQDDSIWICRANGKY